MAERVPIWYEAEDGQDAGLRTYPVIQNTVVRLHRELNLSIAVACRGADNEISCIASSGPVAPAFGTPLIGEDGICAACVRQNRIQLANDAVSDSTVFHPVCEQLGIRSALVIPLREESGSFGFLAAFSEQANRFEPSLIQRMRTEAASIENHLLRRKSHGLRLISSPAVSKPLEYSNEPFPTFARYADRSKHRSRRANVLTHGLRAISIAALAACALTIAFTLPKALQLKGSRFAKRQFATRSEPIGHSSRIQTATVEVPDSTAETALRRLRERAESGDLDAQKALALRYEQGNGVPRDQLKACVWYIIAGASGDAGSKQRAVQLSHGLSQYQIAQIRFNVGKMYMQGIGTQRDLVTAYSWFALAQAAGDIRAGLEQEKLESMMSQTQVSQGLRRASDWLLAHHVHDSHDATVLAAVSPHTRSGFKPTR